MLVGADAGEHGGVPGQGDAGVNGGGGPGVRALGHQPLQRRHLALLNRRRLAAVQADDEDMFRARGRLRRQRKETQRSDEGEAADKKGHN